MYIYCSVIIYNVVKVYFQSGYGRPKEYITRMANKKYITEEEKKSTMDIVDEQISIEYKAE